MPGRSGGHSGTQTSRPPIPIKALDCFGHSYLDDPFMGTGYSSSITGLNANSLFHNLFAAGMGLTPNVVRNHGVGGAQFLAPGRSQGGFARALSEMDHDGRISPPFVRSGGAYLFCWGANDVGNTASGSQTLLRSAWANAMRALISKARASSIYLAATSGNWAFGANFSTSPTSSADFTSGSATSKQATVVDSAGTSTATFTIPQDYQGEPICFNMVALSGGSLIVTWGGTAATAGGTSGINGRTDTLSAASTQATTAYGVRFTGPVNGLSAANAGQTISVRITTVSASTFTLDGCWIEAFKPPPVLWCNFPRLPERNVTHSSGSGVTTGVTTNFTDANMAFLAATDVGQSIVETDAQGAFTAGKTISSVTNATTVVLSGNATGAFTSIRYTLARALLGYSNGQYGFSNTNFTGATAASHAAADADVTNLNATMLTTAQEFDAMVQIVDFDAAMGGDSNLPANVLSWFALDGNHFNDFGKQRAALQCWRAVAAMRAAPDLADFTPADLVTGAIEFVGSDRRIIVSGQVYLADTEGWGAPYLAVAGDMFAMPIFFTKPNLQIGASMVEQMNAPATAGSNIRIGIYDDHNFSGYPQCLRKEPTSGGAFAMGTTVGVKNPGAFSKAVYYGLYWLVVKIDSLGTTASQFRTIMGPSRYLPAWAAAGGAATPICWRLTGVGAGALPSIFPAGGVLWNTAPALGVTLTF
jgi:hypothetical protein